MAPPRPELRRRRRIVPHLSTHLAFDKFEKTEDNEMGFKIVAIKCLLRWVCGCAYLWRRFGFKSETAVVFAVSPLQGTSLVVIILYCSFHCVCATHIFKFHSSPLCHLSGPPSHQQFFLTCTFTSNIESVSRKSFC